MALLLSGRSSCQPGKQVSINRLASGGFSSLQSMSALVNIPASLGFCLFVFASLKLASTEEFITASCVAQSNTER